MCKTKSVAAAIAAGFIGVTGPAFADFPEKPIKVVVPFGAGGGTDAVARVFQNAIEQHNLSEVPFVVTNIKGPGGRIGSRTVKDSDPDGYTILLNHLTLLTSQATGLADFGYEDFEPISGTGDVCQVVSVMDSTPYKSLDDLLVAAKDDPRGMVYGVNLGAASHVGALLLQDQKEGAEFRFVQIGGDAANYTNLIGHHTDVTGIAAGVFKAGEASGIRGLAILADERNPALPDVPTAKEQGVDLSHCFEYWWLAPKGTPTDRVKKLESILSAAMQTPEVQEAMLNQVTLPIYRSGQELKDYIASEYERIAPYAAKALQDQAKK